jgi:hypothetical protein
MAQADVHFVDRNAQRWTQGHSCTGSLMALTTGAYIEQLEHLVCKNCLSCSCYGKAHSTAFCLHDENLIDAHSACRTTEIHTSTQGYRGLTGSPPASALSTAQQPAWPASPSSGSADLVVTAEFIRSRHTHATTFSRQDP